MKGEIFFVFILLFSIPLSAQAPDILWTKTFYGQIGLSVQQTNDGGYIITGVNYNIIPNSTVLIKTNSLGNTIWDKSLEGSGGLCVKQHTDGGYVISGVDYYSTLIKTNPVGTVLWRKGYGGGASFQQTSDAGYIVTGSAPHGTTGLSDVRLVKTDSLGDSVWTKKFDLAIDDWGESVQQTSDGGYLVVGTAIPFLGGPSSFLILKTNASGDSIWSNLLTFGGGNGQGHCLIKTNDGNYVLSGSVEPYYQAGKHPCLVKFDSFGNVIWTRTYEGTASYSVEQTFDGGYIMTGYWYDILLIIKTDPNGSMVWTKWLVWKSIGYSVQQTLDGGYIITGTKSDFYGDYIILVRLAPDTSTVYIEDKSTSSPSIFSLHQNYPNPFNPITTINYQLAVSGEVDLTIYNLLGQQIRTLVSSQQTAGAHQVHWDGTDESGKQVTSGIYFYKLNAGSDFSETKKMVLLR